MNNRPIDPDFWSAPDWNADIANADVAGFACFSDGDLQYAVTRTSRCEMDVIHRAAAEFFSKTVEDSCALAFPSAAVDGSFGDASVLYKTFAWTGSSPEPPDVLELMGDVVIGGARLPLSRSRPKRAFIAYDVASAPNARTYQIGIGDPPADARAGMGGLGPVIVAGKAFSAGKANPNFNQWYADQALLSAFSGKILVALSPNEQFLLLLVQPHACASPVTLDTLRDKLVQAGTLNAVFLDGSDSVTLFVAGDWKIRQGTYKDRVTSFGLRFHFQPDMT